jgi:hypothetical protein
MQAATRLALDSLARSALEAADSLPLTHLAQAEWEYESLRAAARALNAEQDWATEDEFETMFPLAASRLEVDALNELFAAGVSAGSGPTPAEAVRLLLVDLAGWATGVRLAGETFDGAVPEE